ncbi:MAG: hypothetical protein O1I87_08815 [Cylindrospermopsis raciborskii PAMP2012]|nr:hypothetical protein [Cylindrospermopsis raciborskii PAMP2012]
MILQENNRKPLGFKVFHKVIIRVGELASWRVIALLVGGELRWWLLAWLMRGSGIGSSFIGLINSRLFNFPYSDRMAVNPVHLRSTRTCEIALFTILQKIPGEKSVFSVGVFNSIGSPPTPLKKGGF